MKYWPTVKIWLAFLAPSILFGVAVGLYPGYKLYHYTWYDAGFCVSCHVHDYATVGWQNSIHGEKTTCHDCHHQKFRDYIREAIIMAWHRPTFPKDLHHTPYVKTSLCAACHVSNAADRSTITGPFAYEDVQKIPKVDKSRLHNIHLQKETDFTLLNSHALDDNERNIEDLYPTQAYNISKGEKRPIACADCHGGPANRGHNFSSVDATCVRCHEGPHQTKVGQQFGCRSCHFQDFMIPIDEKKMKPVPIEEH